MTEYYRNINPTSADNISAGYQIGDFWENLITYDRYEHVSDGEWCWRKSDGVIVGSESYPTYNLNTGSTGGGVDSISKRVITHSDGGTINVETFVGKVEVSLGYGYGYGYEESIMIGEW